MSLGMSLGMSLRCRSECPSRVPHDVPHDVSQDVPHDVAQDRIDLAEFIKEKIRENNKITRKAIVDEAGVSKNTIERAIKEIDNLKYVGRGSNGHWELDEQKQVLIHSQYRQSIGQILIQLCSYKGV